MTVAIHYSVDGLADVEHHLLGLSARAMEPRPLLELFAEQLRQMTQERFDAEGPGWAPLAGSTLERKGSSQIGRETDAMMNSLTSSGEGHIEEYFGEELLWGTSLVNEEGFPYPAAFDRGTSRQPARPLIEIHAGDLRRFSRSVQAWLMGADRAEFGLQSFSLGDLTFP